MVRPEKRMLTTSGKREPHSHTPQLALPVRTNKDDLKFLACLLDLPVGFHQDPGEASAGWALQEERGILQPDAGSGLPISQPLAKRDWVSRTQIGLGEQNPAYSRDRNKHGRIPPTQGMPGGGSSNKQTPHRDCWKPHQNGSEDYPFRPVKRSHLLAAIIIHNNKRS